MTTIGTKRPSTRAWSKHDEQRLFDFVREHGNKWNVIAKQLDRSVGACQIRFFRHGPEELCAKYRRQTAPDLTPEQVAEATRLRVSGHGGRMDLERIAARMKVRPVQIQRIFAPHEVARKKYKPSGERQYVMPDIVIVPREVVAERDRAYERPRFCAAELLGDPPFHRSALAKKLAGLSA